MTGMSLMRLCMVGITVAAIALAPRTAAAEQAAAGSEESPLKVFLDCEGCFSDFLRAEVPFVDHVRDRAEADVHVLISTIETGSGGREYTIVFTGLKAFSGADRTLRTTTTRSDPEDVVRRQLANTLRLGLLNYIAGAGVPPHLEISVRLDPVDSSASPTTDRWDHWVFSARGFASFEGEESSRETQLGGSVSADRITPDWKITLGGEIEHETEEFTLDDDTPVKVRRRERDFDWLVVKALGEHWSLGGTGRVESSTFENTKLSAAAAAAVEFNVFPYSAYTRRQLRALYAIGAERREYYDLTVFGKTRETLPAHELSLTYEQLERWGSLGARTEWSQFLHDLDKSRLEIDAEISLRVTRGLSVGAELNASRIRDQLSLTVRGASPEEVLLRIRELRSGYEYHVAMNITYSFGSIFSSVVNPRFGR